MSTRDGGPIGRREVAYRLFAAEYDDADLDYSDSEEERAPNYVVTPTGARINRLFVVGVLTEVEPVSDEVLRARVVDPTGAFVVYAGQYQPEAVAYLEEAEVPSFVSVTGKARTFQPDGSDRVFTSVRPESITGVDGQTRDRWTVQAAEHTLARIATMAAALERAERGDDLVEVLGAEGVDPGLAAGVALAVDHYGTTEAYLSALREVAIAAMEVVADRRDSVPPFDLAPADDGPVAGDLRAAPAVAGTLGAAELAVASVAGDAGTPAAEETPTVDRGEAVEPAASSEDAPAATEPAADAEEPEELGDFEPRDLTGEGAEASDAKPAEVYELDEAEREAVEAEFGTEFSTGSEVGAPGEADIDASADAEPTEPGPPEPAEPAEPAEEAPASDAEASVDEEPTAEAVDLEDAAVETMAALDEGEGADREAVVDALVEAHGADREAVRAAIQEALMSGRCYEPSDGRLKAI